MRVRSQLRAVTATALAAALILGPSLASAQAGLGAWDPGAMPMANGSNGNSTLGNNAAGSGVANPLGFPETTPPLTPGPAPRYNANIEYAKGFTDFNLAKFAEAKQDFEHALSVDPRNAKTLFMLGETMLGLGDVKGAADAFARAVKLAPDQVTIRTEYAVALARNGDPDQARAQFAILKARADACGGACPQADDLKAALVRVQAALAGGIGANS